MADSENEDEFFECDSETEKQSNADAVTFEASSSDANGTALAIDKLKLNSSNGSTPQQKEEKVSKWGSRASLPVPMISRNNFSVWTFLKQCIGKELSKITMPVIFNEPISFLQRMTEYLEYSQLLNQAATCQDPVRRFEHVIAFAVSSAASNWERIGKPFNPLLGETYELDRLDLGFQYFSEQVSHHPPVSAFHVTSPGYTFHGSIHPKLKFWGKSVEVTPKGLVTLYLKEFDETYTWQNINCCIHNIIVGKLWIEHYGTMEIVNHKAKTKCVLNFKPSGWFGKDLHKVEGFLYDSNKKKVRALYGKWIEALYSYDVKVWEKYMQANNNRTPSASNIAQSPAAQPESDDDPMPERGSSSNLSLEDQRILWLADLRPFDSERYYHFTHFAIMLNECKPAVKDVLPPTDSRLRPDMRKLEEGDLDGAAAEKHRLEEKQRAVRKDRKKSGDEWRPKWFKIETNKFTGKEEWTYQGKYWDRKWDTCPNIF